MNFNDLAVVQRYKYLEILELENNSLTGNQSRHLCNLDTNVELDLPFLITLNLAKNKLSRLNIKTPDNLQDLDISHNEFKGCDFTDHRFLRKCNLSGNGICAISNL
jgi:hypothetical protein